MRTVARFENLGAEQIRQRLLNEGVNEHFIAELDDKVAEELLERITFLLKNNEERCRQL